MFWARKETTKLRSEKEELIKENQELQKWINELQRDFNIEKSKNLELSNKVELTEVIESKSLLDDSSKNKEFKMSVSPEKEQFLQEMILNLETFNIDFEKRIEENNKKIETMKKQLLNLRKILESRWYILVHLSQKRSRPTGFHSWVAFTAHVIKMVNYDELIALWATLDHNPDDKVLIDKNSVKCVKLELDDVSLSWNRIDNNRVIGW